MTYRADLDALAARHAALDAEVAAKTKERDDVHNLLEDARAKHRLPVLDNIRVASPCNADWSQMSGDDRVRACGQCNKRVYNLSEMTRDEAQALLISLEGKLCARYFRRADGTILTKDCAVGVQRRRRIRWIAAGAAALLGTGAAALFAHRGEPAPEGTHIYVPTAEQLVDTVMEIQHDDPVITEEEPGKMLMGDIAAPPPTDH